MLLGVADGLWERTRDDLLDLLVGDAGIEEGIDLKPVVTF